MLVFLGIAAQIPDPVVVPAHFLCPGADHGVRHRVGPAKGFQIGCRLVRVRRVQITLGRDARVAAMKAFRRFFQDQNLRPLVMRRDRRSHAGAAEPQNNDVRFPIPFIRFQV